jgi:hypothetical protein
VFYAEGKLRGSGNKMLEFGGEDGEESCSPAKLSKANVTLLGIGWSEDLCLDNQVTLTLSVVATTADMYYLTIRAIFL